MKEASVILKDVDGGGQISISKLVLIFRETATPFPRIPGLHPRVGSAVVKGEHPADPRLYPLSFLDGGPSQ